MYLEDSNSKFGTLIRVKKEICLDPDIKIKVQCGKTLLKLSICKPWSIFGCFSSCNKGKESDDEFQRLRENTQESYLNNS